MAHQFLQGLDVDPVLHHVHGEGVPECLRGQFLFQMRLFPVFLQDFPEPLPGERLPQIIHEQNSGGILRIPVLHQRPPAGFNIFRHRPAGRPSHRHNPGAAVFPVQRHEPHLQIQVRQPHFDDLTDPDARGVHELQDRPVPLPLDRIIRKRKQFLHRFHTEVRDFLPPDLRGPDVIRRVFLNDPPALKVAVKRPERSQFPAHRRLGLSAVFQFQQIGHDIRISHVLQVLHPAAGCKFPECHDVPLIRLDGILGHIPRILQIIQKNI